MGDEKHPRGWVDKDPKPKIPTITKEMESEIQLDVAILMAKVGGKTDYNEKIPYGSWVTLEAPKLIDMTDEEISGKIKAAYRNGWDDAKRGF